MILPIGIINSLLDKFNFRYTERSGRKMPNAHHILANMLLVLGHKRIAFLLQPADYKFKRTYKKILDLVIGTDQFISHEISQGHLITLNDREHIDLIMRKNYDDDKELGLILSYPCAGDLLSADEFTKNNWRQKGSFNHIVTRSNQGDVMSNICLKENKHKFTIYFNDISRYISEITQNRIELQLEN
jgi:hypothetical protein